MEGKRDQKKFNIILGCVALMIVTSLPLLTDFLVVGTKLYQQLSRVEALVEGIRQFGITMWSKPEWIDPAGLSFAYQYGDTFLYVAVVLRMLGFSVQAAFRGMLLLINVLTVLAAYYSFKRIWKDGYTGLLGAAVYCTAIYRCALLYGETELGELLALLFIPLVVVGVYELVCGISGIAVETLDAENDATKQDAVSGQPWQIPGWGLLTLGLSGVLRGQIFAFAVTCIVVIIFLLLGVKAWRKRSFWMSLGKSITAFVIWNIGYLYTAFYYVKSGQFILNPYAGQKIQEKGIQAAQLFMGFYQGGPSHDFGTAGISEAAPIGLGIVMLAGIIAFLYLLVIYGEKIKRQEKMEGLTLLIVGAVFIWGSLLCFPWDALARTIPALAGVISSMQAPWHLLLVPTILFSMLICLTYQVMKRNWAEYSRYFGLGMFALTILCSGYLMANLLYTMDFVRCYSLDDVISYGAATGAVMAGYAGTTWYLMQAVSLIGFVATLVIALRRNGKKEGK